MYRLYSFLVAAAIVGLFIFFASCQKSNPPADKTFTVIFNSNGGVSVESQTVKEGEKALKPTDPIKFGNIFEGWYKEATLTNEWDFDTDVVTFSLTLYAKWAPIVYEGNTYTVTFNSNGGVSVNPQTVREGERVTRPANPTKSGNRFVGWCKESALTTEWRFNTDVVTSDITLYAKWTTEIVPPFETKEEVMTFLKNCAEDGNILFGRHLDMTMILTESKERQMIRYNSENDALPTNSDVFRITGKRPAVLGIDVFEPFQPAGNSQVGHGPSMINAIKIFARQTNGLINISCHIENPWWDVEGRQGSTYRYISRNHPNVVRQILEKDGPVTLKTGYTVKQFYDEKLDQAIEHMRQMTFANGKQIPLMVRLFHEASREFFWWGDGHCSHAEYIELFRYTVNRMREKCDHLMFIYGPDRNWDDLSPNGKYMERYPGDEYVDILGYDDYFLGCNTDMSTGIGENMNNITGAVNRLRLLSQYAKTHNKVVALAETGRMLEGGVGVKNWFMDYMYRTITAEGVGISFFLIWSSWPQIAGNAIDSGVMFPYQYNSAGADDARRFVSQDRIKMNDFIMAK